MKNITKSTHKCMCIIKGVDSMEIYSYERSLYLISTVRLHNFQSISDIFLEHSLVIYKYYRLINY